MKKSKHIGLMLGACLLFAGAGVGQASTAFAATTTTSDDAIKICVENYEKLNKHYRDEASGNLGESLGFL